MVRRRERNQTSSEVIMVPADYPSFFDAASQAAGALIGLLFVVIALKPGKIVGVRAEPTSRRLAASRLRGASTRSLSLLAYSGPQLGIGAAIVAAFSLYHTWRLHLGLTGATSTSSSLSACWPMGPNFA